MEFFFLFNYFCCPRRCAYTILEVFTTFLSKIFAGCYLLFVAKINWCIFYRRNIFYNFFQLFIPNKIVKKITRFLCNEINFFAFISTTITEILQTIPGSRDIFLSGPQLTAYGIRTPTGNNNEIYLAQGVPDIGFIHFSSHALQQDVTLLDDVHGTAHYATRDTRIFAIHFSTGITKKYKPKLWWWSSPYFWTGPEKCLFSVKNKQFSYNYR